MSSEPPEIRFVRRRPFARRRGPLRAAPALALAWGTLAAAPASADPAKTTVEQGFERGEVQSARALAMGGGLYAIGTSTTALYANPAALPFARMYHFEGLASYSPEAQRQAFGGAVVDSMTSKLAGGVAYDWTQLDPAGIRREWHDVRVGFAYPIVERFSIGVLGRYVNATQPTGRGPFGFSLASDGTAHGPLLNTVTADLGLNLGLGDSVRVGAVAKNIVNSGSALLPTTLGGGAGFQTGELALTADAVADLTTWKRTKARIGLGAEVFLVDRVALRAGYRYDDGVRAHAISGGAGYIDRQWSAELGVRRDVNGATPVTMFALSLRFFYDGGGGSAADVNDSQ